MHHLHGLGRRRTTGGGRNAGRHDDNAVFFEFVERAAKHFRQVVAHHQLSHRAATRVSRADENDQSTRKPPHRGLAHDALAEHFKVIVFNANDRRRLPITQGPSSSTSATSLSKYLTTSWAVTASA